MRGPAVRPVLLAAGGTGGHLFPAEALAAALRARGERVVLVTDPRGAERARDAFPGGEIHGLEVSGLAGRGALAAARGALSLAAGTLAARRLLDGLSPSAVVGFGGYPSVPPVLAARLLPRGRRPTVVLHEQNGVLGRANRWLCRGADLLALSWPGTAGVPAGARAAVLGNPVRPAVASLAGGGYAPPGPEERLRLLVLGGSLGARVFSEVVPAALALLPAERRARLALVQQAREEGLPGLRAALEALGVSAETAAFFPDVAARLRAAHLVLARAGASTVAELACAGRPALLVPLPRAVDDHQTANARALAAAGGAEILPQAALTPAVLAAALDKRLDAPQSLVEAAAAAATLARPGAAAALADRLLTLLAEPPLGKAA